jgi:hypothetical protein
MIAWGLRTGQLRMTLGNRGRNQHDHDAPPGCRHLRLVVSRDGRRLAPPSIRTERRFEGSRQGSRLQPQAPEARLRGTPDDSECPVFPMN